MPLVAPRKWSIREASPHDVPALAELFRLVFGSRDEESTHWKYFESPWGRAVVMIAETGGRVIGQRVLLPIPLRVGARLVQGAQSVDVMTHPDYRHQGIQLELANAAREFAEIRGTELLFGFPNRAGLEGSVRHLGWHLVGNVPVLMRPLRNDGLARVPVSLRPLMSLVLRAWPRASTDGFTIRVERPSNDAIAGLLQHRVVGMASCQTERSPEWYDWRFSPNTGRHYHWLTLQTGSRLAAFAAWGDAADGRVAYLAEVVSDTDDSSASAIAAVIDEARAAGFSVLLALTNRQALLDALRTNGFRAWDQQAFKVRALAGRVFDVDIFAQESWQLFGADFDVF